MAVGIKDENYKVFESQASQVQSATTNVSEEKTSSAKETPVNTGGNEKHSKGAREIATSRKADAQLQAMSVKLQLQASEQTLTTISKPASNVQQLAQPANDQGPVVSKQYAQQKDSASQTEKENSSESLRKEIAGALNVPEDSPLVEVTKVLVGAQQREVEKLERANNANNAPSLEVTKPTVLSDESVKHNQEIIDAALTYGRKLETIVGGEMQAKMFTEYIPSSKLADMDAFIRQGTEMTLNGERIKVTQYLKPGSPTLLGQVTSVIKGGKETITKVTELVPGSIGLKEGDTRDVPPDQSSPAGKKPSSWDPQPDGRYGSAGQPKNEPNNNDNNGNKGTQTSSEKGQGVGRSDAASSSMGFEAGSGAGDAGTSSGKLYFNSQDNGKTWEKGRSQWTENPPTQVEVEETATHQSQHQQQTEQKKAEEKEKRDAGEKPQMERPQKEATHEPTKKDHGTQAAYGDYADSGVTAPATYSGPGKDKAVAYPIGSYSSGTYVTDVNADLHEGPYNFGDPADPTSNETPSGENPIVIDGNLTHTAGPAETNLNNGVGLEKLGTLKNTGNPLDNSVNETPAGTPPGSGEVERNTD